MYKCVKELQIPIYNESLKELFNIFNTAKYELYLVGGCVRDILLDKFPKDIDLCTSATPKQIKEIIKKTQFESWDSGIKHGTLTLTDLTGASFEITTFRDETEADYSDHRHVTKITFSATLEDDLKRRDLTINSFAYNILTKELLMLNENYLDDLNFGIIRAVGAPEERFEEDALRMLRTIRFAAQLGFSIEEKTLSAIYEKSELLRYISAERIRDELTKILLSDHPEYLDLIRITDLEDYCYINLSRLLVPQHNKHHYTDVLHHTYDVLKATPKDFEIRWAALFHDIGKPDVQTVDEAGYTHYIGHPEVSAQRAELSIDALKFTNKQKEHILTLIKYHDSELYDIKMSHFKKLVNDIGIDLFPKFLALRQADAMAHLLNANENKFAAAISKAKERYAQILRTKDAMTVKDLAINGYDIMADGFLQKEEIGECLSWMLRIVLEHPEYNTHEKLLELLETFKGMSFQNS